MTEVSPRTGTLLLLGLLVFSCVGGAQAQTAAPSPLSGPPALLKRMLDAENSLPLQGTQTTSLPGARASSVQRVWRDGSRAVRVDYLGPPRLAGERIVDNGHLFWHYIPSTGTLEVGPSRLERAHRRSAQVVEQIARGKLLVHPAGQETIAGHACDIIDVSRGTDGSHRRFWIDTTSGAQMAVEQFGRDGQRRSESRYTDVTLNPTFAPDTFHPPHVPKSVKIVSPPIGPPLPSAAAAQAQAGFVLLQPTLLPDGYKFQSASVSRFRGQPVVSLRYGDGLNMLSLFQISLPPDAPTPPASAKIGRPRPGVLTTVQGRVRIILVGSGTPGDLERVITSLH